MTERPRAVVLWLLFAAAMVFAMAVIGAVTRLTESGLSIVEWKPVAQMLPPLSHAEWERVFALYKDSPQYRLVNAGMTLADFQQIFFWEWLHRLWGHLIGIVYAVPFVWFLLKRAIPRGWTRPILGLFGLGLLQGLVGAFMVASGLVDRPSVSHYRLAMHLVLALAIFVATIWIARGISSPRPNATTQTLRLRGHAIAAFTLLAITIVWGAFTAGLRAGLVYDTWPLMGLSLVPSEWLDLAPAWINFVENHATVQFTHRLLAYCTCLLVIALSARAIGLARPVKRWGLIAAHLVVLQVALGVATVLSHVPVWLGALHQANAILLLGALTMLVFELGSRHAR
ncbi:COX15/CtaA family protein [Roseiterribacter gracilis]|uniref:Heme A synthase n=1 Tax=Roseiterribacter gracilis TaxID=2812848 RepID=A0A8S8XC00_9PROT|nr:heme A synthase [Rhodospirillales bacterium TMPK1]